LLDALRDADADVRSAAAEALAAVDPGEVAGPVGLLHASDARVRASAAETLGHMGERAAPAAHDLARSVSDTHDVVRSTALEALARIGPAAESVVGVVLDATSRPSARERCAAVRAAAAIGPGRPDCLRAVLHALDDGDVAVRSEAVMALAQIGRVGESAATAVDRIILALADTDLRDVAALALRTLGPTAAGAVPALIRELGRSDVASVHRLALALAAIGPPALAPLLWAAGCRNARARSGAAIALGALGDPAARGAVRALRRDVSPEVRAVAELAWTLLPESVPASDAVDG
jgi:HEAT repeat protein